MGKKHCTLLIILWMLFCSCLLTTSCQSTGKTDGTSTAPSAEVTTAVSTATVPEKYGLLPTPLVDEGDTLILCNPYPMVWECPDEVRAKIEQLFAAILEIPIEEIEEDEEPEDSQILGGFAIEIVNPNYSHAISVRRMTDHMCNVRWFTIDIATGKQTVTSYFTFHSESCNRKIEEIRQLAETICLATAQ